MQITHWIDNKPYDGPTARWGEVTDPAAIILLEGMAEEAPTGRYGIYFGTHEHGRVQRSQEREEP